MKKIKRQAWAELCQAQGNFNLAVLVWFGLVALGLLVWLVQFGIFGVVDLLC